MSKPVFEVRSEWRLIMLPPQPAPWMVQGRSYVVVLRRASARALPEAEVRDRRTDETLGRYSWRHARQLFDVPVVRTGFEH